MGGTFGPGLAQPEIVQLVIFLYLFLISSFALIGGRTLLAGAFQFNHGTLLLVCLFTIVTQPNPRTYYCFSYSLFLSSFIDIFTIGFGWTLSYVGSGFYGFLFFLGFVLTIILIITKVLIGIHQLGIAKVLNGEVPLPLDLNKALNLSKVPAKQPTRTMPMANNGRDIETGNNATENKAQEL